MYNLSMKKDTRKNSYTIYAFQYPILLLIATLFVATLNGSKVMNMQQGYAEGDVLGKENSNSADKDKPDKDVGKPADKGNKGLESPNALLHKKKIKDVVINLNEISDEEDQIGNEEVSDEIEEVAVEEEENVDDVADAIDAVEKRPKWKTLLFGSDYKNLGQLRSSLAHNTNSIRKLHKAQNEVQAYGNEEDVQAQLGELVQERDRIRSVITEHEDDFGILGWVFRFFNGYLGGGLDDDIGDDVDVPETTESTESTESVEL